MSCPDWNLLTAHRREGAESGEPAEWPAALDHLERCASCRDLALVADPTLIFRRLPDAAADDDTIADMRAGVAALRRAGRIAEPARAPEGRARWARPASWWGRAAAAAVLAGGMLGLQPGFEAPSPSEDARRSSAVPPMAWLDESGLDAVDDIENPTASVYHFDDDDLAVVMVVDAGLDV